MNKTFESMIIDALRRLAGDDAKALEGIEHTTVNDLVDSDGADNLVSFTVPTRHADAVLGLFDLDEVAITEDEDDEVTFETWIRA